MKKITLIHLFIFLSIIISYVVLFNYPVPIIFTSLVIHICIFSLIVWILITLGIFLDKNTTALKLIGTTLFTIASYSIILTFLLNYIGNSNWGTNVTFSFIVKYALQLPKLQDTLPIPLNLVYFLLLLFLVALFLIYYKNINVVLAFTSNQLKSIKSRSLTSRNCIYSLLSIFIVPLIFFAYQASQADHVNDMWNGEPLTDLLLPHTSITLDTNQISSLDETIPQLTTDFNLKEKPNIILIIADALRADHLKSYGYHRQTSPFLDSLISSGNAIKIDNAFSTCAESNCGILSTLSSRPYNEINKINIKINNILSKHDYDINFILSADHGWAGLKEHYAPYDVFYDGNDSGELASTDDQFLLNKLSSIKPYENPSFFYFHLMSNHSASSRKQKFNTFLPTKSSNDWFYRLPIISNIFNTDKTLLETNYYDNGIIATDFYISRLLEQLTKKGYMNNSIVIITADHGEALGEHGHYGHIGKLYNEEIGIPIIIIDNQVELYKEREFATQLDIAPTILDRLGIKIPTNWKGQSLLKKKTGTLFTHHDVPNRKGDKAIIMKTDDNQIFKMLYSDKPFKISGVFDLKKDKLEKNNLNNSSNENLIQKLLEQLQKEKLASDKSYVKN